MAGNNLQPVYVARTMELPQKKYETFLGALARPLGRGAIIYNARSTHLTFLESDGVKKRFYEYGYTSADVVAFRLGLQGFLNKKGHDKPSVAQVDPEQSLRLLGKKIAINIVKTPQLEDQRGLIEQYTRGQIGELPTIRDFEPHITIGELKGLRASDVKANPDILLPAGIRRPSTLALNGLEVYVGAIHALRQSAVPSEQAMVRAALDDFDGLDTAFINVDPDAIV